MHKKTLFVVLVLLVAMTVSVSAASAGSIGFVNYASLEAFESGDSNAYLPGLRAELFLNDFLGISADAILLDSYTWLGYEVTEMLYFFNAVGRIPLGFIEPYLAVGPGYYSIIIGDEVFSDDDAFTFNARAGVDLNIFDWLSVGIEANYFVDDLEEFFSNFSDYFTESSLKGSLIGVTAKFKF